MLQKEGELGSFSDMYNTISIAGFNVDDIGVCGRSQFKAAF